MCGQYERIKSFKAAAKLLHAKALEEEANDPQIKIALPTQQLPIVPAGAVREMILARWGLIPSWAKDKKIGSKMINARAETVETKFSFNRLIAGRRCLVPAAAFYEWQGEKGAKTKYAIKPQEGKLLTFAGLYDTWQPPEGGPVLTTYTIITTAANEVMAPVHDRMPLILTPEERKVWLDPEADPAALHQILAHMPEVGLSIAEVVEEADKAKKEAKPPKKSSSRKGFGGEGQLSLF